MKTNHTMRTTNSESFVYEPIRAEAPEPAVRVSEFLRLIAQLTPEPKPIELPVIV